MIKYLPKFLFSFAMITLLISITASTPGMFARADIVYRVSETIEAFDCNPVTEITVTECQALVAIYNSANGINWENQTNWLLNNTPCNWFGVICTGSHVRRLALAANRLSGSLPIELGQLTELQELSLSTNQLLGTIPSQLGNATRLQRLYLQDNQLSGHIPPELSNLVDLQKLYLSANQLTGNIPPQLGNLTNLQELGLSNNEFSGNLPASLGNLTNLQRLYLQSNRLTGSIPSELSQLLTLQKLYLSVNQLSGEVPPSFANLSNLQELDLSDNELSGLIPSQLGNLLGLQRLYLQTNQFTGEIPVDLGKLTNLQKLYLSFNQLSGHIPSQLGDLTNVQELYLSHNQLTGPLPAQIGQLSSMITLTVGANSLSGALPTNLVNLPAIQSFEFGYTDLCVPTDTPFRAWLNGIQHVISSGRSCTPETGDAYENDNSCTQANDTTIDGSGQSHTFHRLDDTDWVKFNAVQGIRYQLDAITPADSIADITTELYADCNTLSQSQAYTFTPDVRIEFLSPVTGPLYLKLANNSSGAGVKATYQLSVRSLNAAPPASASALIVAAGRLKTNDAIQPNIYQVTDAVRQLFQAHNYSDAQIQYLAPDTNHPGVDAAATIANLQEAITVWANNTVGTNGALTIYLMDHGTNDIIYLDKPNGQSVTPQQLNDWLLTFEATHSDAKVNVIIEACFAGSFISAPATLSKAGRVVIASTTDAAPAWASTAGGAIFSNHLIEELSRNSNLLTSFERATAATSVAQALQVAWLDANGNGMPNEPGDRAIAAQRGFGVPGTLLDEEWPPYIVQVEALGQLLKDQGELRAHVLDDGTIKQVHALIYPPTYHTPVNSEALVRDEVDPSVTHLLLTSQDNGWYRAPYPDWSTPGVYRVVFFAEDNLGLEAQPITLEITIHAPPLFLPIIIR